MPLLSSNKAINILGKVSGDPAYGNIPLKDIQALAKNEKYRKRAGFSIDKEDASLLNSDNEKLAANDDGNISNLTLSNRIRMAHLNQDGSLKKGAIAGSALLGYIGVSSAFRIASGGGLYKDRNGNTDIIGIPFI